MICGHLHCATLREIGGLTYVESGDWVGSCIGFVEPVDGRLESTSGWRERSFPIKAPAPEAHCRFLTQTAYESTEGSGRQTRRA